MNVSQQMFLLASEEISFSKAAEKAFVTPQCFSEHIKRLEDQYQAVLFHRRPRLQLTAEGQIMLRYLKRIQALENSMRDELANSKNGVRGMIRLGIPSTRGVTIVPKVTSRFQACFPQVDIQVRNEDTRILEEMLLNGQIDIMLGVDASRNALFQRTSLGSEALYLVMSVETMKRYFGENCPQIQKEFKTNGADLCLMQEIPFVQGYLHSTTTIALQEYLQKHAITLKISLLSSNFDVQAELCKMDHYATICSRLYVRRLINIEEQHSEESRLLVFQIRNMTKRLEIELITHRDTPLPAYLTTFSKIMRDVVSEENVSVCNWLFDHGIGV